MTREWFTTYCQNAAANVLDRDNAVRFTYVQLKATLVAAAEHRASEIPSAVIQLHDNICHLCDARHDGTKLTENDEYAMLLTLANIHAAYLMVSGLWKEEEPVKTEGGVDEYGFEIF